MSLFDNEFMTVSQVAAHFGFDRKTIYIWLRKGIAPRHECVLGRYCFYRDAVLAYVPPKKGKPARG